MLLNEHLRMDTDTKLFDETSKFEEEKTSNWLDGIKETMNLLKEVLDSFKELAYIFNSNSGMMTIDQLTPNQINQNLNIDNIKTMILKEIQKNPQLVIEIIDYAQNYFGDIKLSELKEKLLSELGKYEQK